MFPTRRRPEGRPSGRPWRALKRRAGTLGSQDDSDKTRLPPDVPPQTPLDFALAVMRDDTKADALRAGMAKAVLPYLHKRGEEEGATEPAPKSETMSDLELARRVAFILKLGEKQQDREEAATRSGEDPVASTAPHSSPAPPANAGEFGFTPAPLNEERAQRKDQPDPHPAYRWIS